MDDLLSGAFSKWLAQKYTQTSNELIYPFAFPILWKSLRAS